MSNFSFTDVLCLITPPTSVLYITTHLFFSSDYYVENEHERLSNFALGHAYPSRAYEFTPDLLGGGGGGGEGDPCCSSF